MKYESDLTRKAAEMERYSEQLVEADGTGQRCWLMGRQEDGVYVKYADAQRALDAERAAKEAYQSTVVDLRKELATLQAQLRQAVGERDEAASDRDDWITSWRVLQRHNERIEAALTPAAGGTRHGDTVRRVS